MLMVMQKLSLVANPKTDTIKLGWFHSPATAEAGNNNNYGIDEFKSANILQRMILKINDHL